MGRIESTQFVCNGLSSSAIANIVIGEFWVLKVFSFFRFQCISKTGHKIATQEENPIYTILSVTLFSLFCKL